MHLILSTPEESWELSWGLNLIGTGEECDVRLKASSGAPKVAAVLVRWLQECICLGVGNPPALKVNGHPTVYARLDFRKAPEALRKQYLVEVGTVQLTLTWETVGAVPGIDQLSQAQLESVLGAAREVPARTLRPTDLHEVGEHLARLLGRMSGATTAHPTGSPPVGGATTILRSIRRTWPDLPIQLEWAGQPPEQARVESLSRELSLSLEAIVAERARPQSPAGDPPSYREGRVKLPYLRFFLGPWHLLDSRDVAHLSLAPGRVRNPQTLISTFGGRVEMVDLAEPTRLSVNGVPIRYAIVTASDRVTICDLPVEIEFQSAQDESAVPARVFRTLALNVDPITQMARLGLLLPQLTDPSHRRMAYQLAALGAIKADGMAVGTVDDQGRHSWGRAMTRSWMGAVYTSSFEGSALLEKAIAQASDGEFVSADVGFEPGLLDGLCSTLPDRRVPLWGPLAILSSPGRATVLMWRTPGEPAFRPIDLTLLRLIRSCLERDQLTESRGPTVDPAAPRFEPVASSSWLEWRGFKLPIGPVSVLGRDAECDIQVQWDQSVSSLHLLLLREPGGAHRVLDFRSTNGLAVNGATVDEAALKDRDVLKLGESELVFRQLSGEAPLGASSRYLPLDAPLSPDPTRVAEVRAMVRLGRAISRDADLPGKAEHVAQVLHQIMGADAFVVRIVDPPGEIQVLGQRSSAPAAPGSLDEDLPLLRQAIVTGQVSRLGAAPSVAGAMPHWSGPDGTVATLLRWASPGLVGVVPRLEALLGAIDGALAAPGDGAPAPTRLALPSLGFGGDRVVVTGPTWIGRGAECDVVLDRPEISRRHALVLPLEDDPAALLAIDFKSDAGMWINGQPAPRGRIKDGDTVRVGPCEIQVTVPGGAVAPSAVAGLGALVWAPWLLSLGAELATPRPFRELLAFLAPRLRQTLSFARVTFLDAAVPPTFQSEDMDPRLALPEIGALLDFRQVADLVSRVRSTGRAFVSSTQVVDVYRQHVGTIQLALPAKEKARLCLPFFEGETLKLFAIISSLTPPTVAFRQEELALLAGIWDVLPELAPQI
ncbi:MAG: FHA domain-containing protein [Candidatus Riflebacteria bacterium]|nr:FHA domain-containing protein [Candidatus Riflebacteria bacterium]